MDEYEGEWLATYSGSKFHFTNPQVEEIKIKDIAHHLSLLCRFNGACREFYSVADHSIRVSRLVPYNLKLAALLHDAAEAYIGDISRPVKYAHKLDETERILTNAIDLRYSINSIHPLIKQADNVMIATEARDLMPNTTDWYQLPTPLFNVIIPLTSKEAEELFLQKFVQYGGIDD